MSYEKQIPRQARNDGRAPASCHICCGPASGLIEEFLSDGHWWAVCRKCVTEQRRRIIADMQWAEEDGTEYFGKFPIIRCSDALPLPIRQELMVE